MIAVKEKLTAKVLVVDDREENLFAMEKILQTLGCEIYKAHSGNEAMSFTLRHDFALILLDVNMPEMNGFELAEILRSNKKTKLLPIIFVTAINKEDTSVYKGYETGAVDFLFKPVNTDILLSKVKVFIELDLQKKSLESVKTELESSNKALRVKSEFLAMMSHEIRTPMNGVIGITDLLLELKLEPEQRKYAEIIRNSSNALMSLINNILDYSKIESGKMELEQEPFELLSLVQETFELFTAAALERGLNMEYHIDEKLPQLVAGDVTRLRQVLINLIGNAVKFTKSGGIYVTINQVSLQGDSLEIEFVIKDSGIGIPPLKMADLFKPFSQLDSSMARKYGGTGLGLAICKTLVELMGGTIRAEQDVEQGAIFIFTIQTKSFSFF
ncbi:MAG TPA: ATP-binding protein [Bacilli bacterium]